MDLDDALSAEIVKEWINPHVLTRVELDNHREKFNNAVPFFHQYIDDFLKVDKLEELADELAEQEFEIKESDLFQLAQTDDFDNLEANILLSFKDMFRSDAFLTIMNYITGIPLSTDVDSLGNIYRDTDYLLCHDDKLIKRKIAYILYLTDLDQTEGGGLKLYSSHDNQPDEIVKTIYPRYNRFMFFKVTRQSFHEVEEVMGDEVFRVTVSGWFNNEEEEEEQ